MVCMARVNRKRLHDLRTERGLTQFELAVKSGVSMRVLTALETKSSANPTLDTLSKLATALEVKVVDIILEAD
jgi:transcriptional regulator with XRE-family HTH domain